MFIVMSDFAKKHFREDARGTKITSILPEEFIALVNNEYFSYGKLVDGYAPFCKHFFCVNFTDAKPVVMEITDGNRGLLHSGYLARRPEELPVLCRWFDAADFPNREYAKTLDIILYSKEQMEKEGEKVDGEWAIVSINAINGDAEEPMVPITIMRNALGIEEGGSGYPLDREAYLKSVEFWETHAIIVEK